jgi:hypothetical protein
VNEQIFKAIINETYFLKVAFYILAALTDLQVDGGKEWLIRRKN